MRITIFKSNLNAYTPYQENKEQMENSLFSEAYESAKNSIIEIIKQSREMKTNNLKSIEECSNIIAFTGERGSGKTSAILSFANVLNEKGYISNDCYFECLPIIDPSHINKDETILDVVISRLYSLFEKYCEENRNDEGSPFTMEKRRTVYQSFQELYKAIRSVCQDRGDRHSQPDTLESLRYIAAGNELRNIIYSFLKTYLSTIRPTLVNDNITRYLVISVDDLDMNAEQGYAICEELRKYFNLPNVIILFSVKMSQLNDIVRQEYSKWFKIRLERDINFADSIPEMAAKYIDKLIPMGRRCELPNFQLDNLGEVYIQYEDTIKETESREYNSERLLTNEILYLLYIKCGLLLVKNSYNTHSFIPINLRGIVHLVALLQGMKSVSLIEQKADLSNEYAYIVHYLTQKEKKELQHNLNIIDKYIQQHSISEMSENNGKFLYDISVEPWQGINQRIARYLYNCFAIGELTRQETKIINDIVSEATIAENVSIGDVLFILRKFQISQNTYKGERFAAILKVIYSIKVLKILFLGNIDNDNSTQRFISNKNKLFQMLGGLIYVPKIDKILPSDRDWNPSLSLRNLREHVSDQNNSNWQDWLLVHTIRIGLLTEDDNSSTFRRNIDEPYYSNVNNDMFTNRFGNTFQYFSESHLACLTNCLRLKMSNENLETDDYVLYNNNYKYWLENQISAIPLFSIDYLSEFIPHLFRYIELRLRYEIKGNYLYYQEMVNGIRRLNEKLIYKQTAIPKNIEQWIINCTKSFPFWTDTAIKENADIEYLSRKVDSGLISVKSEIEQILSKVIESKDKEQLAAAVSNNFSLRKVPEEIKEQLIPKQRRVAQLRTKILNSKSEIEIYDLRLEIIDNLKDAISRVSLGNEDE